MVKQSTGGNSGLAQCRYDSQWLIFQFLQAARAPSRQTLAATLREFRFINIFQFFKQF